MTVQTYLLWPGVRERRWRRQLLGPRRICRSLSGLFPGSPAARCGSDQRCDRAAASRSQHRASVSRQSGTAGFTAWSAARLATCPPAALGRRPTPPDDSISISSLPTTAAGRLLVTAQRVGSRGRWAIASRPPPHYEMPPSVVALPPPPPPTAAVSLHASCRLMTLPGRQNTRARSKCFSAASASCHRGGEIRWQARIKA